MENVDFLDLPQKRFKMLTTGTIILASAIRKSQKVGPANLYPSRERVIRRKLSLIFGP